MEGENRFNAQTISAIKPTNLRDFHPPRQIPPDGVLQFHQKTIFFSAASLKLFRQLLLSRVSRLHGDF